MRKGLKLLVLAGSAEARLIAQTAQARGADVHAALSEPPRGPNPMPVPATLMPFINVEAVMAGMRGFDAVLDASHGFDSSMSALAFEAASRLKLPFVMYRRPTWSVDGQAGWDRVSDVDAAMNRIDAGARVFSTAGWASLPDCAAFPGERLYLRQTAQHDRRPLFDFVELAFGDPPFTVDSEIALFEDLDIDTLLCRNLGGAASRPKLDAALALGLKVLLLDRPALPDGAAVFSNMDAVLDWIAQR